MYLCFAYFLLRFSQWKDMSMCNCGILSHFTLIHTTTTTTVNMPRQFKLGTHRKPRSQHLKQKSPPEPENLIVSLPLSAFTGAPLHSTKSLTKRLEVVGGLPCGRFISIPCLHCLKM